MIHNLVKTRLPTRYGDFSLYVYAEHGKEHLALVKGSVSGQFGVPVRVHSECLTGDVFASRRCDCGDQLKHTLNYLGRMDAGVLIYLRQEGRGIGLLKKMEAYNLQDAGLDTVEANLQLGHQADERDYGIAARILRSLHVDSIRLITNNPHKVEELQHHGVTVDARIPIEVGHHAENLGYLKSKAERMAHLLSFREQVPQSYDFDFLDPLVSQLRLARSAPHSRPWVSLVYVQTLDGRIFEDFRLTNSGLARFLSVAHDAVLRDPKGDSSVASLASGSGQLPLQVIVDHEGVFEGGVDRHDADLLLTRSLDATKKARWQAAGIEVEALPFASDDQLDVPALLGMLQNRGVATLMVEAGPQLHAAFVRARAVDFCVAAILPEVTGGGGAVDEGFTVRDCQYQALGSQLVAFGPVEFK